MSLTFKKLHDTNAQRANRWHEGFSAGMGDWSGADWANAMQGEAGEVAEVFVEMMKVFSEFIAATGKAGNTVKKLRRAETGHPAKNQPTVVELIMQLGEEVADVVIYGDLLATYWGASLEDEIIAKFNKVSEREGWELKL